MGTKEPIKPEQLYEFITGMLRYSEEKIISTFGLYVKLVSAIVGGVAWL